MQTILITDLINHLYEINEIDNNNFDLLWFEKSDEIENKKLTVLYTYKKEIDIDVDFKKGEYIVNNNSDIKYTTLILVQVCYTDHLYDLEYLINKYYEIKEELKTKKKFIIDQEFKNYDAVTFTKITD